MCRSHDIDRCNSQTSCALTADIVCGAEDAGQASVDSHNLRHLLPSVTTDTEPWSTEVQLLHDHNTIDRDNRLQTARHATAAALGTGLGQKGQAVQSNISVSLSGTDVSPDRSPTDAS